MPELNKLFLEKIFELNFDDTYETEVAKKCFNIIGVLVLATDPEGYITFINQRGCEILEYTEEEIIGKHWINFVVAAEHRDESVIHFESSLQNPSEASAMFPYVILSKSGKKKTIETRSVLIKNNTDNITGSIITGEEVTNFHIVQNELENLIYQYRILAGSIPDTNMYLFDKNLRFIIAEGSDMKKYNLSKVDFEGKTIYEVLDNETRKILIPLFEAVIAGLDISKEYQYKGNDYIISLIPMKDNDGNVYGGMAITQNITIEKRASQSLQKAKELAEESNRSKSNFLASVSHEIRTPLNAIIGFTEQLSKTRLSKQQNNYIEIINNSSEHLLSLVNEILVLSKIDAGEVFFSENPFKPSNVIIDVFNTLKIKAKEKSINFKYTIKGNEELILLGDSMRLKQILMNLAGNSIKFTDSGFVELKYYVEEKSDSEVMLKVDVIDTGIGIPEDKLSEIFVQFKQADTTINKRYGGTGLGLTICKHLVELQNGTITVKSEVGAGSQFNISIPYKKSMDKNQEFLEEAKIDSSILENLSILLVDDDNINRLLGKTILENFKCKVDLAQNGKEAIDKISVHTYDILLLDIHMPDITGLEVAYYIRQVQKDNDTIIIAVTAAVMKNDIISYFNAGINDYLVKPFRELNLFNKIHKSLGSGNRLIDFHEQDAADHPAEMENSLYNLSDLEHIAKSDPVFMKKMLNIFIQNSKEGLKAMRINLKKKNWIQIGEHAHRMLPSFRHLHINSVVSDLVEIKNKTIINPDYEDVPDLVKKVTLEMHVVNFKIRKEVRLLKEKIGKDV